MDEGYSTKEVILAIVHCRGLERLELGDQVDDIGLDARMIEHPSLAGESNIPQLEHLAD